MSELSELLNELGQERFHRLGLEAVGQALKTSAGRAEIAKSLSFESCREYVSFLCREVRKLADAEDQLMAGNI
jgi:hypothetical protein